MAGTTNAERIKKAKELEKESETEYVEEDVMMGLGPKIELLGNHVRILPMKNIHKSTVDNLMDQIGSAYIHMATMSDNPAGTFGIQGGESIKGEYEGEKYEIHPMTAEDIRSNLRSLQVSLSSEQIEAMYKIVELALNGIPPGHPSQEFTRRELEELVPIGSFPKFLCKYLDAAEMLF